MRSLDVLNPGGILVSAVSPPTPDELAANTEVRSVFFIVEVTTTRLNKIAELFDRKRLIPRVGTVLSLSDAKVAHQMLAGAPHGRGKIVLKVST